MNHDEEAKEIVKQVRAEARTGIPITNAKDRKRVYDGYTICLNMLYDALNRHHRSYDLLENTLIMSRKVRELMAIDKGPNRS